MRYRLRTLVIATAVGPVLLALAWFVGIWLWNALPDLVRQWELSLAMLAMLCSVALVTVSLAWPPPDSDDEDRAPRWTAVVVAGGQFFALWGALWPMFSLLVWLFIWGDNQGQREADTVWYAAVLAAALFAANVAVRGMVGLVSRRYVLVNAALTVVVLILVAPMYLWRWLR